MTLWLLEGAGRASSIVGEPFGTSTTLGAARAVPTRLLAGRGRASSSTGWRGSANSCTAWSQESSARGGRGLAVFLRCCRCSPNQATAGDRLVDGGSSGGGNGGGGGAERKTQLPYKKIAGNAFGNGRGRRSTRYSRRPCPWLGGGFTGRLVTPEQRRAERGRQGGRRRLRRRRLREGVEDVECRAL